MKQAPADHYQWICPRCRRALFGLAQGKLWENAEPELATEITEVTEVLEQERRALAADPLPLALCSPPLRG